MTAHEAVLVDRLVLAPKAEPFDLVIPPGKVTGLAGLERGGQERFLEALAGLRVPLSGTVHIDGTGVLPGPWSLQAAFRRGIAYLPRDRKVEGIFPSRPVLENFAIATLPRKSRFGLLRNRAIQRDFATFAERLGIVCGDPENPIRTLSGGNQQKVLLARWLATNPQYLLLNDPSRGVDHPTRLAMYQIYRQVAAEGTTVILLSSEIEELIEVSDRVLVFRESTVSADLLAGDINRERILAGMFGTFHA